MSGGILHWRDADVSLGCLLRRIKEKDCEKLIVGIFPNKIGDTRLLQR
jgi:hypothetical protein